MLSAVTADKVDREVQKHVTKALYNFAVDNFHRNPVELIVGLFEVKVFLEELLGIRLDEEFKLFTKDKIREQIKIDKVREKLVDMAESEDSRVDENFPMFS